MLVHKFGGTSLASVSELKAVADILLESSKQDKITVVLSAMGKVTDDLIILINAAIKDENWQVLLEDLEKFHQNTLIELNCACGIEAQRQQMSIAYLFQEAQAKLQGVALLGQCPDDVYAWLITLGEQLSVAIMYSQLISLGLSVKIIDARKNVITVDDAFDGVVERQQTKQNLSQYKKCTQDVLLMAGFAASSVSGKATTLGRNGSDYSAAICAISLEAEMCTIWTDVDGVYNANPSEIRSAYLIPQLSYYEAMELSYFGASVLHPKTITPLMQADIPCIIRNTNNLSCKGTLISHNSHQSNNFATAISSLHNISMVTVSGPGMKGMVGMAARVFDTMSQENISVVLITQSSSEYSISFCIDTNTKTAAKKSLEETF